MASLAGVVLLSLACGPALAGCAGDAGPGAPAAEPVALATEQVVSMAMKMERKQAEMPAGFPVQVPVVDGTIGPGVAYDEGNGLWIYEITAPYPSATVVEWYRRAYTNANWVVLGQNEAETAQGLAVTLELEKGAGARSMVTVRPAGEGKALVEATVGIGAPTGATY